MTSSIFSSTIKSTDSISSLISFILDLKKLGLVEYEQSAVPDVVLAQLDFDFLSVAEGASS